MLKRIRIYQYTLIVIGIFLLASAAFGQDLGSSSGLFNKPKAKKTPVKPTPKRVVTARKATPRPKPVVARRARKTKEIPSLETRSEIAVENPDEKNTVPETVINIAPSKPSVPPSKTSVETPAAVGNKSIGDFNEIYEQAIAEGNDARDVRQYVKAESSYLRAQNLQGKDSRAVYGLGNLYSDQQRWEEAERAYRAALQIEPTAPESYIALSFVLTQPIIGANLADRYGEAERLARKAIELEPDNALAYDQLGVALELGGATSEQARAKYRKAIELEPNFALAYAHLGRILIKTGLTDEANDAYGQAVKLATDVPTMILVADVLQSQEKFAESEPLLRRALDEDEKNPTALYLLGRALTVRQEYYEAEKVLKKSAQVSPNSFVSYMLLGSMSMRRGKFSEAEKYLMQAVKVVSPNEKKRLAQEFEAVGDSYFKFGRRKDAARVFEQAIALDKEKVSLIQKLAAASVK